MKQRNKYAEKLRSLREKENLTRKELAEKLNLKVSIVDNLELGRKQFTADVLLLISDYFKLTVDDFLGIEQELTTKEQAIKDSDPKHILDRYYSLPEYAQSSVDNTIDNLNNVLIAASGAENLTEEQKQENINLGIEYYKKAHNIN